MPNTLSEIQPLTKDAWIVVQSDPQRNVPISFRHAIYQKMNSTRTNSPPSLNPIRCKLGLLTSQYVLPVWQSITPIWNYSEKEIKTWNLSVEELEQFRNLPDDNVFPERVVEMMNGLLKGTIRADVAMQRIHEEHVWEVAGAIVLEFFQIRKDLPLVACHACETAVTALYESLGYDFFNGLSDLGNFIDDNLPDHYRDAASHAVIAYGGGTAKEPVNFDKRQEFWEWWLKEAIPIACSN